MRPACTCAGPATGYPQHESYCGRDEHDDLTSDLDLPGMWTFADFEGGRPDDVPVPPTNTFPPRRVTA